jgi:phage shock protein C
MQERKTMPSKKTKPSSTMKKLVRPVQGRKIAGVAMAFANYFEIDATLIRVILALTLIPGGFPGLLIYLLCWILIPGEE